MPVNQSSEVSTQQAASLKQSVEEALGTENIVIDLQMMDTDTFTNAAFYTETPDQNDYDITYSGWGPDYQDPSTYLDILETTSGAMTSKLGVDSSTTDVIKTVGLDKYDALLKEASDEKLDVVKRYEKYAEAQAWLTDSAIVIPYMSLGGTPSVSKVIPYTASVSDVGIKNVGSSFYKYMEVGTEVNKAEDVYAKREKWLKEKAESNAKAQEELANHVE
jgi:oligopeptide transport system substrate-binding protein